MPTERFAFEGHAGDRLAARLDLPQGTPRGAALFAHCFTCSKDIAAARRIAARLAAAGWAVLRFDFTGLGHSDGEFANTGFRANIADLEAAAAALAARGLAPGLLVGHSLGGTAALAAAARIPGVSAVATIGAPSDPAHALESLDATDLATIRAEGRGRVTLAGRSFDISRDFVDDLEAASIADRLGHLRAALLVMHAPRDMQVGIAHAGRIFAAARHPKSFIGLDGADHLLTDPADADYAAEMIAAFAARHIPAAEARDPAPDGPPEGVVRVAEADPDGFLQDVSVEGRLALRADEPAAHGGTGLGPSPYQFVSAGLGACTAMTIRMYARRKDWPLEHVSVDVAHDKIHAADCADCETRAGKVDRFARTVRLAGPLDPEQRARLLEIADRCPVHRTLEGEVVIETAADPETSGG